jgi:hypothetical protein
MRPIILFPKLYLLIPLQGTIPSLAERYHTLLTLFLREFRKPCRLDQV